MKPETRFELTRELEKIKVASVGANAAWLFALGIVAEIIGGSAFIAFSIRMTIASVAEDRLYWAGYSILLLGVILLGHAGYLMAKRNFNRHLTSLYEAVLEISAAPAE